MFDDNEPVHTSWLDVLGVVSIFLPECDLDLAYDVHAKTQMIKHNKYFIMNL